MTDTCYLLMAEDSGDGDDKVLMGDQPGSYPTVQNNVLIAESESQIADPTPRGVCNRIRKALRTDFLRGTRRSA